jgi:hypothetical protein
MPPKTLLHGGEVALSAGILLVWTVPIWTVCFEGDNDTLYMDSVYAIDAIQSCGAKVVWITPRMREEWQRKTLGRN